ncbi:hypothetical protein LguiA_024844 [Lonicera macranthoides]
MGRTPDWKNHSQIECCVIVLFSSVLILWACFRDPTAFNVAVYAPHTTSLAFWPCEEA